MPPSVVILALAGIAFTLVVVAIGTYAKHAGRARQYAHLERMQAMKMGLTPPTTVPIPGPLAVVAIGAGVPMVGVMGAVAATSMLPFETREFENYLWIIWSATVFLALCGLGAGLALGLLLHRAKAREAETTAAASAKPTHDPDMFDAAHRGY